MDALVVAADPRCVVLPVGSPVSPAISKKFRRQSTALVRAISGFITYSGPAWPDESSPVVIFRGTSACTRSFTSRAKPFAPIFARGCGRMQLQFADTACKRSCHIHSSKWATGVPRPALQQQRSCRGRPCVIAAAQNTAGYGEARFHSAYLNVHMVPSSTLLSSCHDPGRISARASSA